MPCRRSVQAAALLVVFTGKAVADVIWYGAEASVRRGLGRSPATRADRVGRTPCRAGASCGTMGW